MCEYSAMTSIFHFHLRTEHRLFDVQNCIYIKLWKNGKNWSNLYNKEKGGWHETSSSCIPIFLGSLIFFLLKRFSWKKLRSNRFQWDLLILSWRLWENLSVKKLGNRPSFSFARESFSFCFLWPVRSSLIVDRLEIHQRCDEIKFSVRFRSLISLLFTALLVEL